ncbi:MAG: hypothetical protein HQM16_07260 [Deltaproteobacteria bacterium]|nr:hypothetical protein [Deltaproteobacteria bacterium]
MASTYLSLHYHVVFAVKNRIPVIALEWQSRLHDYLGGTIRGLGGISQHHHKQSSKEELIELLARAEVAYDPKYFE